VAFNWSLAHVKAVMGQREAEATYGISGDDQTPSISWSLYSLRKAWNTAKGEVAPWWGECSKEAFNTGLDGLARSLKNWGDARSGKRKGAPVGFPRFKSKHRTRLSCRFTTGAIRCQTKHAVLPRLGRIKMHEDAAGLASLVDAGAARVMSAVAGVRAGPVERGRSLSTWRSPP
jgi:putative transposase